MIAGAEIAGEIEIAAAPPLGEEAIWRPPRSTLEVSPERERLPGSSRASRITQRWC